MKGARTLQKKAILVSMVGRALVAILFLTVALNFALSVVPALAYAVGPMQDCAAIQRALIASGQPVPGACGQFNDSALLGGGCSNPAEAKEFLKTRTGNKQSIEGLTPAFACNLMRFIQAAPGNITIGVGVYQINPAHTVANKGVAFCKVMQCVEGSNSHPRGLAADLIYNGKTMKPVASTVEQCKRDSLCIWAHENADRFGLQYRLMPGHPCYPGRPESWHIELKGTACGGDGGSPSPFASPPGTSPFRGLSGMVREALYGPQTSPTPLQPVALSSSVTDTFEQASLVTPALHGGAEAPLVPVADPNSDAARRLAELAGSQPNPLPSAGETVPVVLDGSARTIALHQAAFAPADGGAVPYQPYVPTQAPFTLGAGTPGSQTWLDTLTWYATPFGGYPGARYDI